MTPTYTICSAPLDGVALEFQFVRQADRSVHQLFIRQLDNRRPKTGVLTSIEGDPGEPWPPSPPLQQLSEHRIHGRPAVLALGMAGGCHWSASFSSTAEDVPELLCDMACRLARTPANLGNRYSVDSARLSGIQAKDRWLEIESEMGPQLTIVPADQRDARSEWRLEDQRQIVIRPVGSVDLSLPTTIRWQYSIRLRVSPLTEHPNLACPKSEK